VTRDRRQTILVVEDGDSVRTLISEMLRQYGYSVIEARNGQDALKIWQNDPDAVNLVLTDVLMPHMSGGELALRMTGLRPQTRFLFMSGYTGSNILNEYEQVDRLFLQKPFTASMLHDKVRQVLEGDWEGLEAFRRRSAQTS
jgi:CheY-like chemotaxis protein